MPRAEAQAAEPFCGGLPSSGNFWEKKSSECKSRDCFAPRGRGTGQEEGKAQLQDQVWRGSVLQQLQHREGFGKQSHAHRDATEMCLHNHFISSCQMRPEYVTLSTLQSRDPGFNQRHSRLSTKSQYFPESSAKLLASLQTFTF